MPTCPDLRALFGNRFIVKFEQSYWADVGAGVRRGDRWLQIVPCTGSRGHLYPWGENELAASVDKPRLVKALMALGCCQLVQDGSDGATIVFAVAQFDSVAQVMRPRRRRRLSPGQRAAATKRLREIANQRGHKTAPEKAA